MNEPQCHLNFREQCRVVWNGIKKGFSYDGCTAVPDFDFGADCCGEHDTYYQSKEISRAEADKKLRECIIKKGYPLIAWSYWIGVRIAGWFFWHRKRKDSSSASSKVLADTAIKLED